ncbi:MAG: SUMF1/EgtB/PvdO family nonheme iron enzyme [Terriglobales bacterium]
MNSTLRFFLFVILLLAVTVGAFSQDTKYPPKGPFIPTPECRSGEHSFLPLRPCSEEQIESWRKDIQHWRFERLLRVGYSGSEYERPELKWTQSSYIQPQMMVEDRYFYDPVANKYTVDRYLDDLDKRYGGIDAVLVWHVYPNIGIDNRNQYDMVRAMPGGIAGVKQMVADFHRRGVRVLFPVIMWDQGTRDEGKPNWVATAEVMAAIGADGVNGDTLAGVPRTFRTASDAAGHPLVLEPEGAPSSDEGLMWNNMTWSYLDIPFTPYISHLKWLETRHMVNISDRWNRNKTDDLQYAWFNGVGYESWENIWSIWNGITPRDSEALRRVATMERALSRFLVSKAWEPLTPTLRFGVFASKWPLGAEMLWSVVNRNENNVTGRQIELPYQAGLRYYDLYHGAELQPSREGEKIVLSFDMEAHGYGAVLATQNADATEQALMTKMKQFTERPLASYSQEWKVLPQQMVTIATTRSPAQPPQDMVKLPAADYVFRVHGIELEGGDDEGVDVQYPWESAPTRYHEHKLHIPALWLDKYPVTNVQFRKFVKDAGYNPADNGNFLKDWRDGNFPSGWDNKPVTWVALEDARAYCSWAGKRLPHEWEWQYAAQGTDGRVYPWGNDWDVAAVPEPDTGRDLRGPDEVTAHPKGASPLGVMDMVGNVWQWTDEFQDEHSRTAILRGGSYYQPQGSLWYFPQAYRADEHGKLLLMAPSKDRAGTLGFRCASDAQ